VADYSAEKAQQGEKWPYVQKETEEGEHWVCDGRSVFEFNHQQKQLVETELPPEMRGNAIAEGPLPFMFGAKASSIRDRYWIREIARGGEDQPYQLELLPKTSGGDFSKVRVYLDPKEFLPERMDVFDLNKVGRTTYQFQNRRVNAVTDNVKNFMDSFVSPKPPRGWTKVVREAGPSGVAPGPQQARSPDPNSPR
jgi:TIGR03009 family protein